MTTSMERPLLLVGCGKMGGALLSGWLESGIAAAGVEVIEPMGAAAFEGKPGVGHFRYVPQAEVSGEAPVSSFLCHDRTLLHAAR